MTSDRDLDQARWRKSSYSGASGGSCLEICEDVPGVVPVRDSKVPHGPVLTLTPTAFAGLINLARHADV
ncbi:DUF397 domain-containing protein [Streptomyces sp. NPDC020965]|uniref:DUF397 domain-containing protein n=1 Tax=Streptomyces sp. NPDC020965 TaxID=3365105 RepID=UPI0037975A64